jgi:hypothetical protein
MQRFVARAGIGPMRGNVFSATGHYWFHNNVGSHARVKLVVLSQPTKAQEKGESHMQLVHDARAHLHQPMAMPEQGLRRKKALWRPSGRKELESFLLAPWATTSWRDRAFPLSVVDGLERRVQSCYKIRTDHVRLLCGANRLIDSSQQDRMLR